ncbi:MAG: LacI family DNA-binding transcriptional regulator, partial [Planctomycetes bacterium]|nr:LacI family DNA-binding transcriptional regulator [Planctomycetota bacterium]
MPITMQDIAEYAGVSRPTVSQALAGACGKYRISEKTRRKVRGAARALGYRPNAAARCMRAGEFGAVALVLSYDVIRSHLP